ncbi:hypothetical protein AGOR_G00016940 [Albula goreensis]|uniref:Uncharacterized protein n=1 Tax=Albula goreensis TaxID=1534307 RepID=A0A8T3DZR1_9TELE|nr:hypothetical protein AGOR_G00016940 [Albula goreensis]
MKERARGWRGPAARSTVSSGRFKTPPPYATPNLHTELTSHKDTADTGASPSTCALPRPLPTSPCTPCPAPLRFTPPYAEKTLPTIIKDSPMINPAPTTQPRPIPNAPITC